MDRRDLLKMIAAVTGMAMVGGDLWAAGAKSADAGTALFTAADIAFMDEIAETILPKTTTPGAKDAACGAMMAVMVADCYELKYQTVFFDGLKTIKALAKQQFDKDFMQLMACAVAYQGGVAVAITLAAIYAEQVIGFQPQETMVLIFVLDVPTSTETQDQDLLLGCMFQSECKKSYRFRFKVGLLKMLNLRWVRFLNVLKQFVDSKSQALL